MSALSRKRKGWGYVHSEKEKRVAVPGQETFKRNNAIITSSLAGANSVWNSAQVKIQDSPGIRLNLALISLCN